MEKPGIIGRIVKLNFDPKTLATALRRGQHARDRYERGITDNIIQLLDPKTGCDPAMLPALLHRQMKNLERAMG